MAMTTVTPIYKPHKKQVLLHNAPVGFDEISLTLYGGARAGGKSAGILMDMVFFCTTYPHAKCCVLRENLSAVKQSFLDKLPTLFPEYITDPNTGKKIRMYEYKEKGGRYPDRVMIFPNGSYITFQRVENLKEAKTKQGWEFHYLAIDEVTKQDEETVNYLLSTVRSTIITNPYTGQPLQIPTKVVFGANPGGIGHKWVKRRFIDTTVVKKCPETNGPLQTKDYIEYMDNPQDKDKPIRMTVRFIPASWKDNPFLSQAYVAMLQQQPEHLRKMDMDGDWDVVAGKMFDYQDKSYLDVPAVNAELESGDNIDWYITIDWGYKPSYHSAIWVACFPDGSSIAVTEMYGQELIFEDFVKAIDERCKQMNIEVTATLLPHDMYRSGDRYRDNEGRIMGETKSDVFAYYGLNPVGVESGKGKVVDRNDKIISAAYIETERNGRNIMKFRIGKGCSKGLINELDHAMADEFSPGMIKKGSADHAIDSYGLWLVYYSTDIAPLGEVSKQIIDTRSRRRKLLEEDHRRGMGLDEDDFEFIDYFEDL